MSLADLHTPGSPAHSLARIADALERVVSQLETRGRGYNARIPAPIYQARARRIVAYLGSLPPGSQIASTRELAEQLDIPAKSFQNGYFVRRVRDAGAVRVKRQGRNYWQLAGGRCSA